MIGANRASAMSSACVMPYTNDVSCNSVTPRVDSVEQIGFGILAVATDRISTQIRQLNTNGQSTVHEKGRFNDSGDVIPHCPAGVEMTH